MALKPPPPSRQGKKQIIAFLLPELIEAVDKKAAAEGKTKQDLIGDAIDIVLLEYDYSPVFFTDAIRIVRRNRGEARLRVDSTTPATRKGRKALGGWFDEGLVNAIVDFSVQERISVQHIVETGLGWIVTG